MTAQQALIKAREQLSNKTKGGTNSPPPYKIHKGTIVLDS